MRLNDDSDEELRQAVIASIELATRLNEQNQRISELALINRESNVERISERNENEEPDDWE